jgi:hypothetical protein
MNWPGLGSLFSSTPRFADAAVATTPRIFGFGSTPAPTPAPPQAPQVSNPAPPQAPALSTQAPQVFNPAPPPVFNPAPPQAPQVFNPAPQPPVSAPRKRKISDTIEENGRPVNTMSNATDPSISLKPPKYDDTPFNTLKRNIFTQLLNKINSHPIFSRCIKEPGFDDIIRQFIFDTLPRGVDSSLAFLKTQGDIDELAAYICRKFLALSVNYPGLGIEQLTPPQPIPNIHNQVLIDLITHRNTELTPTMVKKCVLNPRPYFECALSSIGSSGTTPLRTSLSEEFISAISDGEDRNPPFPCYSVGNYLYSIGPMILDPRGDHIGRNLVMIRVLNYKNHNYPQGNYFWTYPSSSEGGLSRTLFKLPGGVTGATLIKGTEYYSLSEIAALESAINEFSRIAQSTPPTIISDYETFVCFLGNMPHLQKINIAGYLPTITVSNRYCYQFDMTNSPAVDFFSHTAQRGRMSALFFSHIFDNGFDGNYVARNGYNFTPSIHFDFNTIKSRLQARTPPVTFPWVNDVGNLQPVCSFSCIHIDPGTAPRGTSFEWLIKNWHLTHNVQGIEIFRGYPPHPTVCTLTGAMAYVVGHRGNSFLKDMVPTSVLTFLPPLPITRLSTYSNQPDDLTVKLSLGQTRSGNPFNSSRAIFDNEILDGGPEGIVLPGRVKYIIDNIAGFFERSHQETNDPLLEKLKVCLLTFLDITPQDTSSLRPGDFSTFFTERVKSNGIGLKNLLSIQTASTYVRMLAANTLETYLGVPPIPDAPTSFGPVMPPRILVQVSWLGKTHNYVPIAGSDGRVAFEYNNPGHAVEISNIFNRDSNTFDPYIIEARRGANAFSETDLDSMQINRGSAGRRVYNPSMPVVVTNKTMLFRVIIYNDTTNNPGDVTGPESVKFGALEVIVSISSTTAVNEGRGTLHFGTDVQFSVVSITACRHIRGDDGVDHFEKVQTFHGTNADIESVGIWGTNKLGDYAATVMGYDQYHPVISEIFRSLTMIDGDYNSLLVSPYNTPEHWIMKLFAPVLQDDPAEQGQRLRDRIFEKWQWQLPLSALSQIKNRGNVLRLAANLFFSDQGIRADQADDVASVVTDTVPSGSSVESSGVREFLLGPLAYQTQDPNLTPMAETPSSIEYDSDKEGSVVNDDLREWGQADKLVTKPWRGYTDGGRRKPRVNKTKTTQKYKHYRLTNKQKQKSTNVNTKNKNKNKNKNIKTIKNNKRPGSNKPSPKPKSKSKSNLKCKRRMNMNTATRRRCRTT